MSWLGTNNGRRIDLSNPDPDEINIEDIATGLSNICRFNGQLNTWYSVAEHSLNVANLVPHSYKLEALLHDAAEAYICDIPTPLKIDLGAAYQDIELRLIRAIEHRFQLDLHPLPDVVKDADRIMAVSERDAFTATPLEWGEEYENTVRYPNLRAQFNNPRDARIAFLDMYYGLTSEES